MKKIFFISLSFLLIDLSLEAQVTPTVDTTIDQLQVPSSPAFNLLGIAPNSIDRPKNPTDFALALGNASSGFTTIPKDFAMEFAPGWVFGKKRASFEDFKSNKVGKNIGQTSVISIGTTTDKSQIDTTEYRKLAIAYKVSIVRGHLGEEFKKWGDSITTLLNEVSSCAAFELNKLQESDALWNLYKSRIHDSNKDTAKAYQNLLTKRNDLLYQKADSAEQIIDNDKNIITTLKGLQSRSDFNRYGFKLDFALGGVWDYPDSNFQNSNFSKFSSWLTFGYQEDDSKIGILGVLRFSENVNRYFRNNLNRVVNNINYGEFDLGVRLFLDATTKFTLSFEYLSRLPIYSSDKFAKNSIFQPEKSNRYVFSANYKVNKNQNLAFTLGKNFDDTYIKEGNIIAALNFLIGFGSSRPVGGK